MAKDPAFLFYPSAFLTGTMFMTDDQVGKYVRILCAQHQHGHLTAKQMQTLCGGIADEEIYSKFKQDDNGLFYNEKLEEEINKRKEHSTKQKENANKRWQKPGIANAMPLKNTNKDTDKDEIKDSVVLGGSGGKNFDADLVEQKFQEFSNRTQWLEAVSMQLRTGSMEKTHELLYTFLLEQNNSLKLAGRQDDDILHHFNKWAQIEIKKHGRETIASKHEGLESLAERAAQYLQQYNSTHGG